LNFELLSSVWLHEPNAETISRAVKELNLPHADPDELASAYTDLFLLNVYPYGTVYTDPDGELNAPAAQQVADLFEAHHYHPPELNQVGAADHVGLCLGFLAFSADNHDIVIPSPEGARNLFDTPRDSSRETTAQNDMRALLLDWLPVCCLAVEREPSAHPFYRVLASRTGDLLLNAPRTNYQLPIFDLQSLFSQDDEIRLRDIVRFFLAPARCGVFLSRSRLGQIGKQIGARLPFGSRFEVAESLFASAGEAEILDKLTSTLKDEVEAWANEYQSWVEKYPAWKPFGELWLSRTMNATRTLDGMREMMEKIS